MSSTIRINEGIKDILKKAALQQGLSMQTALEEAIELYRKKVFFETLNAAYSEANKDKKFKCELKEMDSTLLDGLEEEYWEQDGK